MGTPIITVKDAIGAAKMTLSRGRSSSTVTTQAMKKAIANSGKLGKRIIAGGSNTTTTLRPSQLKQFLNDVKASSAKVEESQRQFVTWKDTGTIVRKELKILSEEQKKVEGAEGAHGEGKSDWEQKLAERKEKAERKILEIEAKGKEEAALRQQIAKRGQKIASESLKEEIRKEQQKEIQAEQTKLADEDPRKLARYAIDTPD